MVAAAESSEAKTNNEGGDDGDDLGVMTLITVSVALSLAFAFV